jgi:hypothetical protein
MNITTASKISLRIICSAAGLLTAAAPAAEVVPPAGTAKPAASAASAPAVSVLHYTDDTNGFSFSYPATWQTETPAEHADRVKNPAATVAKAFIYCSEKANPAKNINIQYLGDTSKLTPDREHALAGLQLMEAQIKTLMPTKLPGFKFLSDQYRDLAGGVALDITFTSAPDNIPLHQREVIVLSKNKGFIVTCTTSEADFAKTNADCFNALVDSIAVK